jgi:hypothetical protein
MAIIKKYADNLDTHLYQYNTFVVDTDPNSRYFRITEFKDAFTGGKNGFLIEGSEHLMESTEIKIEILDVNNNPIYFEPGDGIPEYYEGTSKVISVYIYNDTPIGQARIAVLGELKTYVDENGVTQTIPEEWKGVYNLKWEKTFKVNPLLANEDKVRFFRRPNVIIQELVKPIFSAGIPSITQTGISDGTAIAPQRFSKLSDYSLPTFYRLQIADNTNWTSSIVGNTITFPNIGYSANVIDVLTNKELLVSNPYTVNGYVESFDNEAYTTTFLNTKEVSNLKSALTGSFAKITLTDLETFVGDVVSVDIYRKSKSKIGDYEFVQKVILESNEILKDYDTNLKNEEVFGILSSDIIKNYWVTSSAVTTTFNQTYLYDSAKLDVPSGKGYFFTTQSLSILKDTEYTLQFNSRLLATSDSTKYVRAFLSGSKVNTYNNVSTTVGYEQPITAIYANDNSLLQKTLISKNFKADEITNPKLYFEVVGSGWHLADISLKAVQETSFSPNQVTFVQSVPRSLEVETFDYRFKFYDVNGNYIPVVVEESKEFNGGNLQKIQKSLRLNPSSLYFQFDSGSQPVPPTVIAFNIQKTLLTGSVNFTSSSIDFFGNVLSASQYVGGVYPGLLNDITASVPFLTVGNFTGSRDDIDVQLVTFTGECEGVTDTVTITAVLDGFGGVNHIIRPYRGTQIRNSSTQSLEIQAIRIDGINDIELSSASRPERFWNLIQLHVLSGSAPYEKFVNLEYASSSKFIKGINTGSLGSREINFNAVFNRDSIDKRVTVYLINSASAASDWAYNTSASVLTSQILEDLQDGLDTPVITYNADTFTIKYRDEFEFRPLSASVTASFYLRGTNEAPISSSIEVYPSMSLNKDFVPEYWMYYVTKSNTWNSDISIVAVDENGREIKSTPYNQFAGLPLSQSKILTTTFTYTEPYTLTQISVDKTFTIVPEGKPGDESIVFELVPSNVTLNANAKGIISTYKPADTELKLKQGAKYLSFTASKEAGTFWLNHVTQSMILTGSVLLSKNYTASLIMSGANNMTELSASLTYDLLIHPYYTSSRYTQSLVQYFTKAVDGAPPIEVLINPQPAVLSAFETGYVKNYTPASTSIQLKEGSDFLIYTSSAQRGTWFFQQITGSGIRVLNSSSLSQTNSPNRAFVNFTDFLPPSVSASVSYNIVAYPYSLLPGHRSGSINLFTSQSFSKQNDAIKARTVNLATSTNTVTFDKDGVLISPTTAIELEATPINYTASLNETYYQFFKYNYDTLTYDAYTGISSYQFGGNLYSIYPDEATSPGETAVWRVELRDGAQNDIVRAIGEVTIFGAKDGGDSYNAKLTNDNTSVTTTLWKAQFTGSGTQIRAQKGTSDLIHVTGSSYGAGTMVQNIKYQNIGYLGYYSASVHSKSSFITLGQNKLTGTPATMIDITGWTNPGINTSGQIVYKIDFEGARATQFLSQSISVQTEGNSPYSAILSNEASSITYKVSGQLSITGTGTTIVASRGNTQLTGVTSFGSPATTIYGTTGYQNEAKVTLYSKSSHLTLAGNLLPGATIPVVNGVAVIGDIQAWSQPETYSTAIVVFEIDCEGLQKLYKTQSLSLTYEGKTGPGVVFRGPWSGSIDYIGSVETTNYRKDAVTYNPYTSTLRYYAAISGSGPNTTNGYGGNVGAQAPTGLETDNAWWQYLGDQQFFVAAKLAIFEESVVKNTLNIGTKDTTGAFANIVLAGGRNDPYMAMGQSGTIGLSGDQVTTGVIGYDKPGIFLGIYENPVPNGTTGRFSIRNADGSKALKWDGTNLYIVGSVRQTLPGVNEPTLRGAWASATEYYNNDIASYSGSSWICTSPISHVSTNSTNATTGYPGAGPWGNYIQSGSNGATGPGVVYRGDWDSATAYIFQNGVRRDVVRYSGNYYVAKLNSTNQLPTAPSSVYWESFGAQFSSVATDILLANDAAIKRGLVLGVDGTAGTGFIRSANATGLTSGTAGPGFYFQQDGKFRVGNNPGGALPYIYWDNDVFTIKGKLLTDDLHVSELGNWKVDNGNFVDSTDSIELNPTAKSISIRDTGGEERIIIKQANVTDPSAGAGTVSLQSPPSYNFVSTLQYNAHNQSYASPTNYTFTPSKTGNYTIAHAAWGSDYLTATSNAGFTYGYFDMALYLEIYNGATLVSSLPLGYGTTIDGPNQTSYTTFNTYGISLNLTAGVTYTATLQVITYGYSSGTITITGGQLQPDTQTLTVGLNQVEIGQNGFVAVANTNNYLKIERYDVLSGTNKPIIDIKTDRPNTPGLRITNTDTSGRAIEVLDGDIYLSGTGNNMRIFGGWIGTDNTTAGVRIGTEPALGKSILIMTNPPAYNPIGGDAGRLRPGQSALGFTNAYRLTYDSSTRRHKTEIEDFPNNAITTIKKLKPILFVPKSGEDMLGSGSYDYSKVFPFEDPRGYIGKLPGFLAEDLDEHQDLRRFLNYEQEKTPVPRSVHYDRLTVLLTKAIQTLINKVESLEAYISGSNV